MKPEEALYHLVNFGLAFVPAFYRNMERGGDDPLGAAAPENAWVGMNETPKEKTEAEAAAPLPAADVVKNCRDVVEARLRRDRASRLLSRRKRQLGNASDDEFTTVANDFDASGRDIAFAP